MTSPQAVNPIARVFDIITSPAVWPWLMILCGTMGLLFLVRFGLAEDQSDRKPRRRADGILPQKIPASNPTPSKSLKKAGKSPSLSRSPNTCPSLGTP